jgi:hypothetical protein
MSHLREVLCQSTGGASAALAIVFYTCKFSKAKAYCLRRLRFGNTFFVAALNTDTTCGSTYITCIFAQS